ncbi:daptide-type RiPP biosynthesis methyltransferase [Actinoplanes sp. NPDC051859]|uniref:daptide-type RiPP biosynthesis methyltransferase n=1 Tax=Actinoplanes sp. NPDC051859 TaxID=3363909 RepID=UPI003789DF79
MTAPAIVMPPGRAGERIAQLGDRVRLCDVYDVHGAPIYHDLAANDAFEVREIVRAVRAMPGAVLDLAAGSGRFTFPVLALGRSVTALDLSEDMLGLLRERLEAAPARLRAACTVVHGDMAGFDLGSGFATIVLGTTSISLLNAAGRGRLFRSVVDHLEPGGQFLFTVLERGDTSGPDEQVDQVAGASGTRYEVYDHWPVGSASRVVTILPADPAEGPVYACTDEVGITDVPAVERELAEAGLRILERRALTPAGGRHHVTLLKAVRA